MGASQALRDEDSSTANCTLRGVGGNGGDVGYEAQVVCCLDECVDTLVPAVKVDLLKA